MLLACDIGNTNTVFGVFDGDRLVGSFRFATRADRTADELGIFLRDLVERLPDAAGPLDRAVVSSVVPRLTPVAYSAVQNICATEPLLVTSDMPLPIAVDVDEPEAVGADRLCNAVAAAALYGGEVIVVDFGTAITLDIIDARPAYVGGAIFPGPETALRALTRDAAQLPAVTVAPPQSIVGRTTVGAMQAGLFSGTLGAIDHLIEQSLAELNWTNPTLVATGGLGAAFVGPSRYLSAHNPDLTLTGLRLIAEFDDGQ